MHLILQFSPPEWVYMSVLWSKKLENLSVAWVAQQSSLWSKQIA